MSEPWAGDDYNLTDIGRGLLLDPLATRHIHAIRAGNTFIRTPEDVIAERLWRLGTFAILEDHDPNLTYMQVDPENRQAAMKRIIHQALKATPYLWTEEVRHVVPLHVPDHVLSPRVLPEPRMWWTFETGIGMPLAGPLKDNAGNIRLDATGQQMEELTVDSVLLRDRLDAVEVVVFGMIHRKTNPETEVRDVPKEGLPAIYGGHAEYGSRYPDDFGVLQRPVGALLPLLAFLNSPYIPKQQQRLSRGARRERARANLPADEEVTFIILRRPAPRKHTDEQDSEPQTWKHRWIVSGHLRAQWYPLEQAHHLIWIAPYVKGPEDAPMLTHVAKVAR